MKTYWVFDRITCKWKKVTTTIAQWAAMPHAAKYLGCVVAGGLIGGGLAQLPPRPYHADKAPVPHYMPAGDIIRDFDQPSYKPIVFSPPVVPTYDCCVVEPPFSDCCIVTPPEKPHPVSEAPSYIILLTAFALFSFLWKKERK